MEKRILVAYSSKHNTTKEISDRIENVLREAGHSAEAVQVSNVNGLDSYHAVVLGSAVYMGKWQKDAARFMKRKKTVLSQKPVWIFSSGPLGTGDPVELVHGQKLPKSLQPIADHIGPHAVEVFHGAVTVEKLGGFEKWALNRTHAEIGDFRDWNAIDQWANQIAEALKLNTGSEKTP